MILLEIDAVGASLYEFESDAPWPVNMNRVTGRFESTKGMEIEAGHIHFRGRGGRIEPVQPNQDSFVQPGINLRSTSGRPKIRKRLALERFDHAQYVNN